jgi:hypothetical protein
LLCIIQRQRNPSIAIELEVVGVQIVKSMIAPLRFLAICTKVEAVLTKNTIGADFPTNVWSVAPFGTRGKNASASYHGERAQAGG